jgi:major membrane immunogen (membrane-anchored lipoprotein)
MVGNVKSFETAHNEKLKKLSKEERAKAGLKKLAEEMIRKGSEIPEPQGLASGATDKDGKMIIDLEEDYDDEQ